MALVPNIYELRSEPTTPLQKTSSVEHLTSCVPFPSMGNPIEMTLKDTAFIFCFESYCSAIEVKPK